MIRALVDFHLKNKRTGEQRIGRHIMPAKSKRRYFQVFRHKTGADAERKLREWVNDTKWLEENENTDAFSVGGDKVVGMDLWMP